MYYSDVLPIALAILTSIITGGFVLVFVEIGNRKNRENDKHDQIMAPFMHKLSAFFRYISWSSSHIIYPKPLDDYEEDFKNLIKEIGGYGGRAITSGGDYGIDYFTAEKLYRIAFDINNIWYLHDKMHPCRLTWDNRTHSDEYISKELKEINPIYLKDAISVDLVAKVSGEFYTDVYQPIENETYKHEAYQEHYKRQTTLVAGFVCFVLFLLSIMLFVKLPTILLQIGTLLVILMLVAGLLMLAINIRTQIKCWNKIIDYMEKHKPKAFKDTVTRIWKIIKKSFESVFSFLLSKMVVVGLLLSIWAIFSIEIDLIPKIQIGFSDATIKGLNKVFLALAYSYVAGVIIFLFTVVFPRFLYRRKMKPIVEQNIKNIGSHLHNMLLDFCVGDGENIRNPKLNDLEDCKDLLVNGDWSKTTVIPSNMGMRRQEAFVKIYKDMQSFIDIFVNDYKGVLTTKQLLVLEEIRHSELGSLLDFSGPMTTDYTVYGKEAIANLFCKIVVNYNKLTA